jgi:hypothetical protein
MNWPAILCAFAVRARRLRRLAVSERSHTDKSRGYCLEMICADFLAGANLENENREVLLQSALRFFKFLPSEEKQTFLHHVTQKAS